MRFRPKWGQARAWCAQRGVMLEVSLAYGALVAIFLTALVQFYIPGKGFTYLISFSGQTEAARLSKLRKLDFHVERTSAGYDAQYYAQIAMDPSLQNRELRKAVDSLPYRARRILFPAVAYGLGLGEPSMILQAYALQNAIAWLLLAGLLLHWFPPRSWDNFIRWTGVLFSFGLCVSLRNSLIDGPSLLLIAFGVYLCDKGRPWWSAAVFALGGLGKETSLLASAALLPGRAAGPRAWGRALLRGVLVAAPLALWLVYIARMVGPAADVGYRNFDLPFAAYLHKWREVLGALPETSLLDLGAVWSLLMLVALTVQMVYLLARPRWDQAWWRVGASYAVLMIFLGDAVWEGYPGAASRVLLPMQLAFNFLVPAGRGWTLVLLLGNLTLLAAPTALEAPLGDGYQVGGPAELVYGKAGEKMRVEFSDTWYATERYRQDSWCWAAESGSLLLHNPHDRPLVGRLRFALGVSGNREGLLKLNGVPEWGGFLTENTQVTVVLNNVVLLPGDTHLELISDTPGRQIGEDPRVLKFRLINFRVDLQRLLPVETAR
ncbi:MAG: hypothetical protein PSV13_09835 [Lacunisphaera sp.]|nr:hypothetical protein [Lacunisphaera sp.]